MLPTEGPPHWLDCGEQEEKEMYKRKEAGEGDREQVRQGFEAGNVRAVGSR